MLNNVSVGTKIFLGFILVVALSLGLGLYTLTSFKDVSHSVENIEYAKLFTTLEVQHRRWNQEVTSLFLENKQELKVQLDHTQCRMGKFIYGQESKDFLTAFPEFERHLHELEPVHKALHQSAAEIQQLWMTGDATQQQAAQGVYSQKTAVSLKQIGGLLDEMSTQLEIKAKGSSENLSSLIDDSINFSSII